MRLFPLLIALLLAACGGSPEVDTLLAVADSLSGVKPDSALRLLQQQEAGVPHWSKSQRMRGELLRARAMNKAYVDFTTDSIIKEVADYYDRHGTANEQMEAHYLLGCVYRDLGEAPRAIEAYQDAAARADTTAQDCDYRTLGCVYSQMARVFHQQLLFANEIEARQNAGHYAYLDKDTLNALYEQKMIAGIYIIQDKKDSAERMLLQSIQLYRRHGYKQDALLTSMMLMHLYVDQPNHQRELGLLVRSFDEEFELFDEHGELPPSIRLYFYYKGKYLENNGQLDSAELCYRKVYRPNMRYIEKNPMYKGLLDVFQKKHEADSIAKYAQLYCNSNDSTLLKNDREQTAKMAASYNYSRYQKQALNNAEKAKARLFSVILLLIATLICLALAVSFRQQYQKKRLAFERLRSEHATFTEQSEKKLQQLQQIENRHQKVIVTIQQELGKLQKENNEAQGIIAQLNSQHDTEKQLLTDEVNSYINKVEELELQMKRFNYWKHSFPFMQLGIVKRVRLLAGDCQKQLTEKDMKLLADAVEEYFPDLHCDLNTTAGISKLAMQVCLLQILNLQPNDMTHLLSISSQQVGNLKKAINEALFNEPTARTLYKNLSERYKFSSY